MAYVIESKERQRLPYLPSRGQLKSGVDVEFDHYAESDVEPLFQILRHIVQVGQTYPQESMDSVEEFRAYYLTHEAFVVREVTSGHVIGAFYVKPNYPGRSGHICNAGFIVHNRWEGQGVASYMVPKFLQVAPDLGYEASIFNLVYATNINSIKLWTRFGFQEVGRIPKAGKLKGIGFTDAIIYYYDFNTVKK